jgi:hypothetical protein
LHGSRRVTQRLSACLRPREVRRRRHRAFAGLQQQAVLRVSLETIILVVVIVLVVLAVLGYFGRGRMRG